MILIYSLIFIVIISIGINYFLWKDKKLDKKNLDSDWQKFLKAVSINDIKGIEVYGDKLIWNKYLLKEQLNQILDEVNSRVTNYPELKKLENNAINKKLHYNRLLPYPGSSGGIKQSW